MTNLGLHLLKEIHLAGLVWMMLLSIIPIPADLFDSDSVSDHLVSSYDPRLFFMNDSNCDVLRYPPLTSSCLPF